jgi:hypothetical protein
MESGGEVAIPRVAKFMGADRADEAIFWFHPLVWWIGARLIVLKPRQDRRPRLTPMTSSL